MPDHCPYCNAPDPNRVTLGDLTVDMNPAGVFWKGVRHHRTPAEVKTLHLLVQRRRVTYDTFLWMTCGEDASSNAVKVRISHLRSFLRRLGAPFTIKSVWNWGYALEDLTS